MQTGENKEEGKAKHGILGSPDVTQPLGRREEAGSLQGGQASLLS